MKDIREEARQAAAALDGLARFASLGLERIQELLGRLGDPQNRWGAYHVAGTNGKGSVSAHLYAALRASGRHVGLYISPPLQDPSERVVVDDHRIGPGDLVGAAQAVRKAMEGMPDRPTAFEAWTALAFWYLAQLGVEVAVVEVGLGGRGDATNVLPRPWATVLVTVHRDHTRQLGRTLAAIAGEKAGIFRPGRPVVLGNLPASARQVALDRARELGCPVLRWGREIRVRRVRPLDAGPGMAFDLRLYLPDGRREAWEDVRTSLCGAHQAVNAALAVAALRAGEMVGGPGLKEADIRRGLATTVWPGRLERVGSVLLDGAHNAQGARALAQALGEMGTRPLWILGGLRDRPPGDLLAPLLPWCREVWAVPVPNPRSRAPQAWVRFAQRRGAQARAFPSVEEALRQAQTAGGDVLVAGSLYLVGAARSALGMAPPWPEADRLVRP